MWRCLLKPVRSWAAAFWISWRQERDIMCIQVERSASAWIHFSGHSDSTGLILEVLLIWIKQDWTLFGVQRFWIKIVLINFCQRALHFETADEGTFNVTDVWVLVEEKHDFWFWVMSLWSVNEFKKGHTNNVMTGFKDRSPSQQHSTVLPYEGSGVSEVTGNLQYCNSKPLIVLLDQALRTTLKTLN